MTDEQQHLDLLDIIGDDAADAPFYCDSQRFRRWEFNTAIPRLEERGYSFLRAYTGDGDSFGPLTRVLVVEKGGNVYELLYG